MSVSETKKNLITAAYGLLRSDSPENITARKIAQAAGCSAGTIYHYFEDVDALLATASVKFLENYIAFIQGVKSDPDDPVYMNEVLWESFSKEAFNNVDVFLLLFYGKYKANLSEKIAEYYEIFPEELKSLSGWFITIFFQNDVMDRTMVLNKRAAAMGKLDPKDVEDVVALQCHLFHSLLLDYRDIYRLEGKAEEGLKKFMTLLRVLMDHFVKK